MVSSHTDSLVPRRARPSFATTLLRLYQGDGLFRSSADFAVSGLVVYTFIAPLPVPSLDWLRNAGTGNPGGGAVGSAPPAVAPPSVPSDIAQAANPSSGKANPLNYKIKREWFKLSDPEIVPALHRAADDVEAGSFAAARTALDAIGRPDDPNVLHLTAIAQAMSREKDWKKHAFEAHMRAARAGNPESMNEVGQFMRLGEAGPIDVNAAFEWYEKGAAAGSGPAAANLGRAYYNGGGRIVDRVKAVQYYKLAAERGDDWGMHNFGGALVNGQGIERDAVSGKEWIEKSAATGLATAQHSLSILARKGLGGPVDLDAFLKWAQAAAKQGYTPALYDLGMFYLAPDDGRPADPTRAAGYLRQAALKKHAAAQFAFATLYERGVGVQENAVQAFVYYSLALRNGEAAAQGRLDALRARLDAKDLDTAQRLVAAAST
jgi:TPR repeat protein